jgi:hypothetical protein
VTVNPPEPQLTDVTTVMQPQLDELLDEPDTLVSLVDPLLLDVELDDELQTDAGARR